MKKRSRLSPALLTLALSVAGILLALAACSKSEEAAGPKQLRMAGIVFQEDQFFRLILAGMHDAAAKHNIELLEANSNNQPEKEFELVNTYASQGVDAILISPLSAKGSVTALQQAHDKGIKIVTNNTTINADFPEASVICSNEDLGSQTGKACRKYIEDHLGGKAKVAILAFKTQEPEQSNARSGGFKKEIAEMPGVQIVAEQDAWLSEMAVNKCGDILTANPDVDIIYAANEGGTAGATLAVKNAGKAGKIAVFGTDVSNQLLSFLQSDENILQAITAQRPFEVGQQSVELALKAVQGQPLDKKVVLNGICLNRTDPAGIASYARQFAEWTGK